MGVHLHARRADAPAHILAAYRAGCRQFDAALGGLGGCPFAQDGLIGNIPTEVLVETLRAEGASLPAITGMVARLRESESIAQEYAADSSDSGALRHEQR